MSPRKTSAKPEIIVQISAGPAGVKMSPKPATATKPKPAAGSKAKSKTPVAKDKSKTPASAGKMSKSPVKAKTAAKKETSAKKTPSEKPTKPLLVPAATPAALKSSFADALKSPSPGPATKDVDATPKISASAAAAFINFQFDAPLSIKSMKIEVAELSPTKRADYVPSDARPVKIATGTRGRKKRGPKKVKLVEMTEEEAKREEKQAKIRAEMRWAHVQTQAGLGKVDEDDEMDLDDDAALEGAQSKPEDDKLERICRERNEADKDQAHKGKWAIVTRQSGRRDIVWQPKFRPNWPRGETPKRMPSSSPVDELDFDWPPLSPNTHARHGLRVHSPSPKMTATGKRMRSPSPKADAGRKKNTVALKDAPTMVDDFPPLEKQPSQELDKPVYKSRSRAGPPVKPIAFRRAPPKEPVAVRKTAKITRKPMMDDPVSLPIRQTQQNKRMAPN